MKDAKSWLRTAFPDDTLVAEQLLRLKDSGSYPPLSSVVLPPTSWGLRQRRSKAAENRRDTRRSSTTLLFSAGGASPCEGYDESSSNLPFQPSDLFRSEQILKCQVESGESEPHQYDDSLTRDVGTKEHLDRMRGTGGHQEQKKTCRSYKSQEGKVILLKNAEALIERVFAKVREDTLDDTRTFIVSILQRQGIRIPNDLVVNPIPTLSSHMNSRIDCHSVDPDPVVDVHKE